MSKEEKTLNFLKTFVKTEIDYCKLEKTDVIDILNVIKKQQKEIEELKEKHKTTKQMNENLIEVLKDSISKDKIREIINKYIDIQEHLKYTSQELYGDDLKNMINELLEEDNNE